MPRQAALVVCERLTIVSSWHAKSHNILYSDIPVLLRSSNGSQISHLHTLCDCRKDSLLGIRVVSAVTLSVKIYFALSVSFDIQALI